MPGRSLINKLSSSTGYKKMVLFARIARIRGLILFLPFFFSLPSCGVYPDLYLKADNLAEQGGLSKQIVTTEYFQLATYSKINSPGTPLSVYIEGDGSAWRTKQILSSDPTPHNPLALKLALSDPTPNVIYLARPCQYVLKKGMGKNCDERYWSSSRYADPVIESINQAISKFKQYASAPGINLIGYSGGGAVAALIASRRNDIKSIRTIAGNLDLASFCRYHGITPMTPSLNPLEIAEQIKMIPQIHFTGSRDKVVPSLIAASFVSRQAGSCCSKSVSVKSAGHNKGWVEKWPSLLEIPLPCSSKCKKYF